MIEIVKSLLVPSQLAMLILIVALVLVVFDCGRKVRAVFLSVGIGMYVLFSTGTIASVLLSPLEYHHPALHDIDEYPETNTIVVLAGYASDDKLMPLSSQPNSHSAFRLIEAFHLFSARPDCDIIISGNRRDVGLLAAQLSRFGVPEEKIVGETSSAHTFISAQELQDTLGTRSFFLVTSAGHMPRAVGVFRELGMDPIPAPTDYLMPRDFRKASILPSSMHLNFSDIAIREYGGILWYRMTGKIGGAPNIES
jgi:uncharacterized SAM-binding protein YcdF (DUF218 family)